VIGFIVTDRARRLAVHALLAGLMVRWVNFEWSWVAVLAWIAMTVNALAAAADLHWFTMFALDIDLHDRDSRA
jgi:hypothetical protein